MNIILSHPKAVMPTKANPNDRCYDLTAVSRELVASNDQFYILYDTGIQLALPENVGVDLRPRSSIRKYDLVFCNSVGTVDNGYRGNLFISMKPIISAKTILRVISRYWRQPIVMLQAAQENKFFEIEDFNVYNVGDKIAQMEFVEQYPDVDFTVVTAFDSETQRGDKGHGSSGT